MKVFDKPMKKLEEAEEAETKRKLLMLQKGGHSRHLPEELLELILANVPNSVTLQEAAGDGRDI